MTAASLLEDTAVAEYLACTPRFVRKLWETRQLAGVKVGRLVRFRKEDLDAFIEAHRVEAVR